MKKIISIVLLLASFVVFVQAQDADRRNIESFKKGQLISTLDGRMQSPVFRVSDKIQDETVIGVFSGVVETQRKADTFLQSGIGQVLVSAKNGAIKAGDYLTSAGDGTAMKATKTGMVIGQAMEDATGDLVKVYIKIGFQKID